MHKIIRFIIALVMAVFLTGCTLQHERSDAEMLEAANEIYLDYLFDYGIDPELFTSPTVINSGTNSKTYKWTLQKANNGDIGVEVVVSRSKGAQTKMNLIGESKAWQPFVGSKKKK